MDKQWVEVELAPVVVPVPAAGLEPEAVAPERTRALGDAFELLTAQRTRREQAVSSTEQDAHRARATKRSRATRRRATPTGIPAGDPFFAIEVGVPFHLACLPIERVPSGG